MRNGFLIASVILAAVLAEGQSPAEPPGVWEPAVVSPSDRMVRLPPVDAAPPVETIPAVENVRPTETTPPAAAPEMGWYQPRYWFGPTWTGGFEVGMNGSEGNAQSFSLRTGANLKRETDWHTLTLEASHARTTADSIETQNNALGKFRLESPFLLIGGAPEGISGKDLPWSTFVSGTAEYDQFKAFDLRLALHTGLGYKFIKNDATSLVGRFGSGVSHELGGPDESYVPEALLGLEFEHKLTAKQKIAIKSEYLPEWGDFENYRLVTDASWECLLDEATNLSLKLGAIDRYDSTPNGRRPNDIDYTLLLLWKL